MVVNSFAGSVERREKQHHSARLNRRILYRIAHYESLTGTSTIYGLVEREVAALGYAALPTGGACYTSEFIIP
jgi:hypothetical protein